jgi:hypothetical protein
MADPVTGLLLGSALGLGRHIGNVAANNNDRQTAAATARYSPWTGHKPNDIRHANFLGDVGGGALTGLATAGLNKGLGLFGGATKGAADAVPAVAGEAAGNAGAMGAGAGAMAGNMGIGPWAAGMGGYGNALMQPPNTSLSTWLAAMGGK